MKEKEKLIEELKQFPMLAQITDADMEDLLLLLKREDFPEGSRIINENEEGDCMYLLLEGQVDVLKTTLYGEEYVCAKLNDSMHCVFGEIAMIDRDRRSATSANLCRNLRKENENLLKVYSALVDEIENDR